MIKSFDFLRHAWNDDNFLKAIKDSIEKQEDSYLQTNIHQLKFNAKKQTLFICPLPNSKEMDEKTIPVTIKYSALNLLLNKKFDDIKPEDIYDIYN